MFKPAGCSIIPFLASEVEHVFRVFLMKMVSSSFLYERLCGRSWQAYLGLDMYEAIITFEMVATQQYATELSVYYNYCHYYYQY